MAEVLTPTATPVPPSPSQVEVEATFEEKAPTISSPASSSSSPAAQRLTANDTKPAQPRERIPSYAQNRMSVYSQRSARTRSRPQSTLTMHDQFPSSLPYCVVRDFAYPTFHPMHHGPPPEPPSGTTTPGSEWNGGRRMSDSAEGGSTSASRWAGPWGGDGGAIYMESDQNLQNQVFEKMDPLPATAFGHYADDDLGDIDPPFRTLKHRKSRSFASMEEFDRGRHRSSSGYRKNNSGLEPASDMYFFSSSQTGAQTQSSAPQYADPAGRATLRQSRSGMDVSSSGSRRDSHFGSTQHSNPPSSSTTLPSRSFHTSQNAVVGSDMPLDSEPYYSNHSPQRESIGPEDEELYAGESLALYGFEPENPNELRLVEGQVVIVSYRHGQGWLVASDPTTGEQGLVPEAYVRLVKHIENWDHERGGFIEDQLDDDALLADDDEDDGDDVDETDEVSRTERSEASVGGRDISEGGEESGNVTRSSGKGESTR